MALPARNDEHGPTAGAQLLGCLQTMWLAYKNGDLLIAPDEIDPQLASDLGSVTPELVVEDEFGWTIHLPGEIVRYDSCWEEPYALMSYALWAQYEDLLDDVRNPDG